MRVAFTTLGCRLNQFETEGMRQRLVGAGLPTPAEVVEWEGDADVYVINSCSVTSRAEQKCRQLARSVRRRRPQSKVVVVGCYPQLSGSALLESGEIDAVLGNEEKRRLDEHLPEILGAGSGVAKVGRYGRQVAMAEEWIEDFGEHSRATVKVQEGCNMRCTFCAIWKARGPSRSRQPRDVVEQVRRLAAAGYEEIVIAGVHVGHYGLDLSSPTSLIELFEMLLELVDPRVRFRLSSIDRSEVTPALIEMLSREERLCRYLHLPLQSGSDAVLRRMRRAYSVGDFRSIVQQVHALDPDFGIGADLIVGFPGETDEEFEETRALLEELPVSFYHVFRYSDRPGTSAAAMPAKVDGTTSARRSEILRELGRRKRRDFVARHVGAVRRGIVESTQDELGRNEVMLDDYASVWVAGIGEHARRHVDVRVDALDENHRLIGTALDRSLVASPDRGEGNS